MALFHNIKVDWRAEGLDTSRIFLKLLLVRWVTRKPLSRSRCMSQALPWPWGSIRTGNLVALVTRIPFWMLSSSVGSPCVHMAKLFTERCQHSLHISLSIVCLTTENEGIGPVSHARPQVGDTQKQSIGMSTINAHVGVTFVCVSKEENAIFDWLMDNLLALSTLQFPHH